MQDEHPGSRQHQPAPAVAPRNCHWKGIALHAEAHLSQYSGILRDSPRSKPTATHVASAAPGGGADKVWVNTESKVYHCQGDRWYGKTKAGEYMTEAEAAAKGYRADRGKACK
jgi:hypothetical protein